MSANHKQDTSANRQSLVLVESFVLFSSRVDACGDNFSPSALMCEESVSDKRPGSFHGGVKTAEIIWSWSKQYLAHSVSHRILCKNAKGEPVSSDSRMWIQAAEFSLFGAKNILLE